MLSFLTTKHIVLLAFAIILSVLTYNSYAFGWKEREKTILEVGNFWRVVLFEAKHPAGGIEKYYRLYDMRNGVKKLVKIGPPLLEKETTEFGAIVHSNTSDWFYPDVLVIVNERFANERGYSDSRFHIFMVKSADDVRLFGPEK